jgi:hypothetical protein
MASNHPFCVAKASAAELLGVAAAILADNDPFDRRFFAVAEKGMENAKAFLARCAGCREDLGSDGEFCRKTP